MKTVVRIEAADGVPQSRADTLMEIQSVFEAAGIEFIGSPNDRPGIRVSTPSNAAPK